MVEVDLLGFMRTCKRLVKQALGTNASESTNRLARWKHVVIHWYRLENDHSYRETENRLQCFSKLLDSVLPIFAIVPLKNIPQRGTGPFL